MHVGHLSGLQRAVKARGQHETGVQVVVLDHLFQVGGGFGKLHLNAVDVAGVAGDLRVAFIYDTKPGRGIEETAEHHANEERENYGQGDGVEKDRRARPDAQVFAQQV